MARRQCPGAPQCELQCFTLHYIPVPTYVHITCVYVCTYVLCVCICLLVVVTTSKLCVFVYTHDVNMCIINLLCTYMYISIILWFILGRVTGRVRWYSDSVSLYSPPPVQCNEVISKINNNHKEIDLHSSSTNSTVSLLSSTKLHTLNLRRLEIWYTPLTNDCIQYLCTLLTNNKTIQELVINGHSISDRGVTNICQALEHNSTLTTLHLYRNPLITFTSGQVLSHLLLNNSSLVELDLRWTSLSTESILLILQSLMDNKKITTLWLDKQHKETCINTYPNYHLIQDRVNWW